MSPTCATRLTCGSALIELINTGIARNSALSVGVVPYGASPYTASVSTPRSGENLALRSGEVAAIAATVDRAETVTTTATPVRTENLRINTSPPRDHDHVPLKGNRGGPPKRCAHLTCTCTAAAQYVR